MASLSPKVWLERAVAKLGSVQAVADRLGYSRQTLSDVRHGKNPGAKFKSSLRDISQGKKQVTLPPPSPKAIKKARERGAAEVKRITLKTKTELALEHNQKILDKAEGKLQRLAEAGVDKVVIYVNLPGAGRSMTLGGKGGIWIDTIRNADSLAAFIQEQAENQRYKIKLVPDGNEDEEPIDILESVVIEEYD